MGWVRIPVVQVVLDRAGQPWCSRIWERGAPQDWLSPAMPNEPTWSPYEPCSERAMAALLHECGILTDSAEIENYVEHVRELDRRVAARGCT